LSISPSVAFQWRQTVVLIRRSPFCLFSKDFSSSHAVLSFWGWLRRLRFFCELACFRAVRIRCELFNRYADDVKRTRWHHAVARRKLLLQDPYAHGSLPRDFPWRDRLSNGRGANGFILTDRGVLFAAVAPILDGFGHGPSRGLVLMGRLLSDAEIAAIGARAQTSVALVAARGGTGP